MPAATAFPYLFHSISIYFLLELWNFPLPGYRSSLKKQAPRKATGSMGPSAIYSLNESEWFLVFYPCQSKGGLMWFVYTLSL
jgi:hypothetical protein